MASVDRIVDRILSDAAGHEFTPQEARWARIEAAARAVLDAYADPLVQSVGDSPVLVELRAAVDDPCPEPVASQGAWAVYGAAGEDRQILDADGEFVAKVRGADIPDSVAVSRARLIAAAPDMLWALRRAAPWLGKLIVEGVHEKCVMPNDARRTLDLVENAIARATGGAL